MFVQTNTIQAVKAYFTDRLKTRFSENEIKHFFYESVVERLSVSKTALLLNDPILVSESDLLFFRSIVKRLLQNEPFQHIIGSTYFYDLKLKTDKRALVPRPETEELCEVILKANLNSPLTGIDIGTGSGCIPITLLCERSNWKFRAIDLSKGALTVAKSNAEKYKLSNRLELVNQNFLENHQLANNYDIIVSNPPYIHPEEKDLLANRVTHFEPHMALFVTDNILEFYIALFDYFEQNTNPNAQLWMETHQDYCDDVVALFNKKFKAKKIEDLSKNPRFVYVVK
jgi:release factor glutamine methyltransferase